MRTPSYRRHKASGQAVVTLSGRDYYLGEYGSEQSRERYRQLLAEWLASGRRGLVRPSPDLTVSEMLASYWGYAKEYYGGEHPGQRDRIRQAVALVRDLYGPTRAGEFGPLALEAVQQEMVRHGLSRRVVNQRVDCIRRAWKWAVSRQLVPVSVYEALRTLPNLRIGRTIAPEPAPVEPAPEDAIAAVRAVASSVVRDLIDVQLLTATRPGEVVRLRGEEIRRDGAVWTVQLARHKTRYRNHNRTLLIGPRCQAVLLPRLERYGGGYLFPPSEALEARGCLATAPRQSRGPGQHYRVSSYSQAVSRLCERVGCAHWHPHQLRHNAATRLVAEHGWEVARIILGHRSIDVTRLYAEDDLARAAEVVRRIG